MSEPGSQQDKPADDPIRLKPLVPRLKRAAPVPSWPAHLCPRCDYDLTGLTSRRCPECGAAFTLVAAREHAYEKSEAGHLQRCEERSARKKASPWLGLRRDLQYAIVITGILLAIVGFLSPLIIEAKWPRPNQWDAALDPVLKAIIRSATVVAIMAPVDVLIAIIAVRKGWQWTPVVLIIGVLTCAVGVIIAMS